jgi:hypothetical protein
VRQLIESAIDEARGDLASVAEPVGVSSLTGVADASATSASWSQAQEHFDAELSSALLARLAQDDPDAVSRLLAQHPEWVDQLREHPPEPTDVLSWWNGLADEGSATQTALLAGAPVIIGALGGIPPLARVEANRNNARHELDRIASERSRLQRQLDAHLADQYDSYSFGHVVDAEEQRLRSEMAAYDNDVRYLEKATTLRDDGTYAVQLVLYDPENARIVEMIGTPDSTTRSTVTYSPGTATTLEQFYDGKVQQVPRWLEVNAPNTVSFVWMDGEFPGGGEHDTTVGGILEANDTDFALRKGEDLAAFREGIQADPYLGSTYDVAIGHSWGLAAVTGSEVADAHYDQVESLAGAYMPPGWEPHPGTTYNHQTYTDFLSMFQDTGAVGGGKNPDVDPAFASETYARDRDFTLYAPSEPSAYAAAPPAGLDATLHPLFNHELIASSEADNLFVLREIELRMREGASS